MVRTHWFLSLLLALVLPGCQQSQPTWDYVALGDSVPAGSGGAGSYVSAYARFIERDAGVSVKVHNLASDGMDSGGLSRALTRNQRTQEAVQKAEIVTVTVGFNDIGIPLDDYAVGSCGGPDNERCFRVGLRRLKKNWMLILRRVHDLTAGGDVIVRVTNDYSELTGSPSASTLGHRATQIFTSYLEEANDYRCSTATRMDFPCADVYCAFNGVDGIQSPYREGLLASDGVHPSAKGNRVIASLLRAFGYKPLDLP